MPLRTADLGVAVDGLRAWLRHDYEAELARGDARVRFMDISLEKQARLEATSPHLSQIRRVLRWLDSPAVVNISHQRIRKYPPALVVGWLWHFRGGVAVGPDSNITPSPPGVDVYP